MLKFTIEAFSRLINWKTSAVGGSAAAVILAQWFGYISIPESAGIVALAEAAVLLFGAKDS